MILRKVCTKFERASKCSYMKPSELHVNNCGFFYDDSCITVPVQLTSVMHLLKILFKTATFTVNGVALRQQHLKYIAGDSDLRLPLPVRLCDALPAVPAQDLHHPVPTTEEQSQVYSITHSKGTVSRARKFSFYK